MLDAGPAGREDAVGAFVRLLNPRTLKQRTLEVLQGTKGRGLRRFAIGVEAYGRTTLHRKQLASAVEDAVRTAFPRWKRSPEGGARFLCKADPEYAVLALQIEANLGGDHGRRAGSLREHLAAGLLTVTRPAPGTAIFDPFMGTGTILKVAAERFSTGPSFGLEVSSDAFESAQRRLEGSDYTLLKTRFEDFDTGLLPESSSLISNVPFGRRFPRAPSTRLIELVQGRPFGGKRVTLLMSREQAKEVSAETGLRARNVLVLGQPASIVHG